MMRNLMYYFEISGEKYQDKESFRIIRFPKRWRLVQPTCNILDYIIYNTQAIQNILRYATNYITLDMIVITNKTKMKCMFNLNSLR